MSISPQKASLLQITDTSEHFITLPTIGSYELILNNLSTIPIYVYIYSLTGSTQYEYQIYLSEPGIDNTNFAVIKRISISTSAKVYIKTNYYSGTSGTINLICSAEGYQTL